MSIQHLVWHVIMQVSIVVCAISPMDTKHVEAFPRMRPTVVVSYDASHQEWGDLPLTLEIQHPGIATDVLLYCNFGGKGQCVVRDGHTLEEAMQQLAESVVSQRKLGATKEPKK